MNILKKAAQKAKDFMKNTKKELKTTKQNFVKNFKRKYTHKKTVQRLAAGNLLTFTYNALDNTKKFDRKPLIISLGRSKGNSKRLLGLNLHWMPENQRVLLASLIVEMLDKKGGVLEYNDVKPLIRKFDGKPILRMYAIHRISQKVIEMPKDVYLRAASIDYADWSE